MRGKYIIIALFFCSNFICGQSKKEEKKILKEKEYQEMKDLISTKKIEFEADWATAQQGARINLIGNGNHLRIIGDSVFAFLPYFGVRTGGGGAYGNGGGIKIENVLSDLKIEYEDKKQRVTMKFSASDGSERINFYMTLFGGGNTSLSASSNSRSNISYDGKTIGYIKEEE
jgi:hypothetical protein